MIKYVLALGLLIGAVFYFEPSAIDISNNEIAKANNGPVYPSLSIATNSSSGGTCTMIMGENAAVMVPCVMSGYGHSSATMSIK